MKILPSGGLKSICLKIAHHLPTSHACSLILGQLANKLMTEYAGDTQINILTCDAEMDGWYVRPSSQGQHLLTWSTDSVSSSWSTALIKFAKVSTAMVVVIGAGLLYMEYLHR